jgi:rare lipoprotein A
MLKTGTAPVKIEAITDFTSYAANSKNNNNRDSVVTAVKETKKADTAIRSSQANIYIQVFATRSQELAKSTATALANLYQQNVVFPEENGIYRVKIGPFHESEDTSELISTLKRSGYESAYRRKILQ